MKRRIAFLMCAVLTAQCAGTRGMPPSTGPAASNAAAVIAAATRIPVGSRVNLTLEDGRRIKAVLLAVEGEDLLLRERTRLPEPPFRVQSGRVAYLELDAARMGVGKMIVIGGAVGAGATLAVLAFLAAMLSD